MNGDVMNTQDAEPAQEKDVMIMQDAEPVEEKDMLAMQDTETHKESSFYDWASMNELHMNRE